MVLLGAFGLAWFGVVCFGSVLWGGWEKSKEVVFCFRHQDVPQSRGGESLVKENLVG